MNWKSQPNLFANGKFKVEDYLGESGIIQGCNHEKWLLIDPPKNHWVQVQGATLIARSIEDMTDEEIFKIYPKDKWEGYEDKARETIKIIQTEWDGSATILLYLLSIGVYPFPDTEDVIFKDNTKDNE